MPLLYCCWSGKPKADVVEAVHEQLRLVARQLAAGDLPLRAFVITKQLTKRPEDYPDAKAQPHVQVRAGWGGGAALLLLGGWPNPPTQQQQQQPRCRAARR
jgi:hypothetical protein